MRASVAWPVWEKWARCALGTTIQAKAKDSFSVTELLGKHHYTLYGVSPVAV